MCLVYRAVHLGRGEPVALKLLVPEEPTTLAVHARFLGVVQSVACLGNEHLARIVDFGVLPDGVPYVASELPGGEDLAGEIARHGVLPPGAAVDIVLQICEALAEAHAAGIVHRAITPRHVWLTVRPDGSAPVAKLLDLGIAPVVPATGVAGNAESGRRERHGESFDYLAPEQLAGGDDRDPRTDIWALGIVLYECLTGVRPFAAGSPAQVARQIASDPPPPLDPRLPRELEAIVMRCLAKSRDARFASVDGLAAALAPFAHEAGRGAMLAARAIVVAQGRPAGSPAPILPMLPVTAVSSARARSSLVRRSATIGGVALAVSVGGIAAAAALLGRSREPAARPATAGLPGLAVAAPPAVTARPGTPAVTRSRSCDTLDVDEVMTRAAIQYDRGAAAPALALARSALACKQTDRMYWLAVMYACAARDVAAARLYFARVPANLQSGVERTCQQDNLDVRSR